MGFWGRVASPYVREARGMGGEAGRIAEGHRKKEEKKRKAFEKEEKRKAAFHEKLVQLGAKQAGTNARLSQRGIFV